MNEDILTVRNLRTYFYTYEGVVKALDGVNLRIKKEETHGLVGETGCGKSVTALSIMRLIQWPPGKIIEGEIIFEGENLLEKSEEEMSNIRGKKIAMIFQEPMSSINPVFTIENQIVEIIKRHQKVNKNEATQMAIEMIREVGLPDPKKVAKQYPHELSGGMRQRALIAMELSCNPHLLIADEPTTYLDVTIQAQILRLMNRLKEKLHASMLLITHDLGIIAQMCDRVAVMYAGDIVENSDVKAIYKNPLHPYTRSLLEAIPKMTEKKEQLGVIRGTVPNLIHPPPGCRFHPRCPHAMEICSQRKPQPMNLGDGHLVSCFLYSRR